VVDSTPAPSEGWTVLVVDDRDASRVAIAGALRDAGCVVVEAERGGDVVALATARRPALVVLSVALPDVDGFEVCRRLRASAETSGIPVLHVWSSDGNRVQSLECGADGYLAHPISPAELVATARALVRSRQAELRARSSALQWEATFRAISDGVVLVDGAGVVRQCNRALADLLGVDAPERLRGERLDRLLGDRFGPLVLPTPAARAVEVEASGRWFRVSADRWSDAAALDGGAVYTIAEITDRKQLEEELRRQTAELLEADRQKDEFLAMLAHELRNPLSAASNALHLLENTARAATGGVRLHAALERQIRHLSRMVDDLLDVSRITRGRIELRRAPVDLVRLVEEALLARRAAIEADGITLTVDLPSAPAWISADATRIEQVLANLLSNAVKYTSRPGSILVRVETRPEHALLRVRDSGIGIAPEKLDAIFDLFVQGDVTLDRSAGGLGIGLTLVRRLVEMHGGSVRAESAGVGRGAEFIVRLPSIAPPAQASLASIATASAHTTPAPAAGARVLVVEDLTDTRETLCEMLALWGHEVLSAAGGPQALELVSNTPPEVALIDIGLPVMDGYEVARRLRRQFGRSVFLVALTGYGQARDQRNAAAAGFDVHVVKPCSPRLLRQLIAERRLPEVTDDAS
jgi:signal transduction histidine kinase